MPAKTAIVQARGRRWDADLTLVIIDFVQRDLRQNTLEQVLRRKAYLMPSEEKGSNVTKEVIDNVPLALQPGLDHFDESDAVCNFRVDDRQGLDFFSD